MKKLLFFLFLGILIPSLTLAQKEPEVKKFFPKLTWQGYITQKATVLALDYYDFQIPSELDYLESSAEEDDSLFLAQINKYLENPKNRDQTLELVYDYIVKKYPQIQAALDEDKLLETILGEFGDYMSVKIQKDLENMQKRSQ